MVHRHYPENISSNGPTNLDPEAIKDDSLLSHCMIGLCSIAIFVDGLVAQNIVLPGLAAAQENADMSDMMGASLAGGVLVCSATFAAKGIRTYRRRIVQAHYNRQINQISKVNDL